MTVSSFHIGVSRFVTSKTGQKKKRKRKTPGISSNYSLPLTTTTTTTKIRLPIPSHRLDTPLLTQTQTDGVASLNTKNNNNNKTGIRQYNRLPTVYIINIYVYIINTCNTIQSRVYTIHYHRLIQYLRTKKQMLYK